MRSIAKVMKAVALGDLSKQIEVDARGEILDLKNTINGMVIRYSHDCVMDSRSWLTRSSCTGRKSRKTRRAGSRT